MTTSFEKKWKGQRRQKKTMFVVQNILDKMHMRQVIV